MAKIGLFYSLDIFSTITYNPLYLAEQYAYYSVRKLTWVKTYNNAFLCLTTQNTYQITQITKGIL